MNGSIAALLAAALLASLPQAAAQTLAPLVTPYVSASDMAEVQQIFNSNPDPGAADLSLRQVHDGLDIAPSGNLKSYRAACSGSVRWVLVFDDSVNVMLDCDSHHTLEYNFEPQAAQTGQAQLAKIAVVKGQALSQGDPIGSLYVANPLAHVHFALRKDWVAVCAEPYFDSSARASLLALVHARFPGADMCHGGDISPVPLIAPYVDESEMASINEGYAATGSVPPWGFAHDGIDLFPRGDMRPFRASCAGTVDSLQLLQNTTTANWQVKLMIGCSQTVANTGGYFSPMETLYLFEPMSSVQAVGQTQLGNISVKAGDRVSQGQIVGYLNTPGAGAHLHFGTIPFGDLLSMGIPSDQVCPEPHFSAAAKTSLLNLLHLTWPGASLCYATGESAAAVMTVLPAWNLLGNGSDAALNVATAFGDPARVDTVWKWLAAASRWAFYSPTLADGGRAHAASNGRDFLTTIEAGEGFWVHAKIAFSAQLPSAIAVQSSSFMPATAAAAGGTRGLPPGWSLIATGDGKTPALFDAAIRTALAAEPEAGKVYANLTAMWAWSASQQRWHFWAPALVNDGSLTAHLAGKGYLDFAAMPTTPAGSLSPTTGFWANLP